ncbi:MAG: recombinase family protein [Boseongicola sp.]|nr:recombinase family protein [Boseongicola sp.]
MISKDGVFFEFWPMAAERQPRTIGYLRVYRQEHDPDKDRADILALANREDLGRVEFVEEKASGRIAWRKRRIADNLEELREGDVLVVSELSRLGHSMLECMETLSIATNVGIMACAIKGSGRLDEIIQSRIIAMAVSAAAEIKCDLLSERTREALRARKVSGKPLGRPKGPSKSKLDPILPEIEALLTNGSTQRFIAKRYKTTPGNLANWMKKNGIRKPKAQGGSVPA